MTLQEAIDKAVDRAEGGTAEVYRDTWQQLSPSKATVMIVCRYGDDIEAFWSDSVFKVYRPSVADAIADDWRVAKAPKKKAPKKRSKR